MDVPPRSGVGTPEEGKPSAGNTTDFLLLIVPILLNEQVTGLIEVWQQPNRPVAAVPGFLQYMHLMADLAAHYQRTQMLRQMTGQEQLWTQLETFTRQVHGSLNPQEVAYVVANDGRRLIECDRVSVAVRYGGRVSIEAVSGADVVEKRSNAVRSCAGSVIASCSGARSSSSTARATTACRPRSSRRWTTTWRKAPVSCWPWRRSRTSARRR